MAYSINPTTVEDYITRRWLLKMSRACLQTLEKRLMDMWEYYIWILVNVFQEKTEKNYTTSEATKMLDNRLEELGINFNCQYNLIKGVLESDKKSMIILKK